MLLRNHLGRSLALIMAALASSCEHSASRSSERTVESPLAVSTAAASGSNPTTTVCDKTRVERGDKAFLDAHGLGVNEFVSRVVGRYSTSLRWSSLASSAALAGVEDAAVALEYANDAVVFPNCNNLVELAMSVSLSSPTGTLGVAAPATLTARSTDQFVVTADLGLNALSALTDKLGSAMLSAPTGYRLQFHNQAGELGGELSVQGPGGASCQIATWPDARKCKLRERSLARDVSYLGMNAASLERMVGADVEPREIRWEDSGAATRLQIEFTPNDDVACVLGGEDEKIPTKQVIYSISGDLHVRTEDGRLSVVLPGRASVSWTDREWSMPELSTEGWTLAQSVKGLPNVAIEELPAATQLVFVLSPPLERISRRTGRGRTLGGLEVFTLDPRSAGTTPAGAACLANAFFGSLKEVTHTNYL